MQFQDAKLARVATSSSNFRLPTLSSRVAPRAARARTASSPLHRTQDKAERGLIRTVWLLRTVEEPVLVIPASVLALTPLKMGNGKSGMQERWL
jgi:hypothetical protein